MHGLIFTSFRDYVSDAFGPEVSAGVFALLMIFYQVWPTWYLLTLPLFTLLALIASTGAGLWLALRRRAA